MEAITGSLASLRAEIEHLNDEVLMGSLSASGALHALALRLLAVAEAADELVYQWGDMPLQRWERALKNALAALTTRDAGRAPSAQPGPAGEE